MCGRYGFVPGKNFDERFQVEHHQETLLPSYNVAPGATMPVVLRNSPNRVELMKWGLIPFWAKDPKNSYKTINARAETVATSPVFREALKRRRCLVPASGFYEWQQTERGKLPYFIHLKDIELFAFAGLYDVWQDAEGNELRTYTIITTTPNDLVQPIHNRMPVILHPDDEAMWIDPKMNDTAALRALLQPFPNALMEAYPVSRAVNTAAIDTPALIEPVAA
ncbi:MAG TPA: SOS response-associated peptidase [Roseiflexaceae bacterium]